MTILKNITRMGDAARRRYLKKCDKALVSLNDHNKELWSALVGVGFGYLVPNPTFQRRHRHHHQEQQQ